MCAPALVTKKKLQDSDEYSRKLRVKNELQGSCTRNIQCKRITNW